MSENKEPGVKVSSIDLTFSNIFDISFKIILANLLICGLILFLGFMVNEILINPR